MSLFIALAGALFFTFAVARLYLRILPAAVRGLVRLLAGHLLSLITLMAFTAILKSHSEFLREDAGLIYVIPQLLWLLADLYADGFGRRRSSGSGAQGTAQRK